MVERITETIKTYSRSFYQDKPIGFLDIDGQEEDLHRFYMRMEEGSLTRDENPYNHFCVYFAAYDPNAKEVFIGYHKKSGLWLFNGGHIDLGETPRQATIREIGEEWGNVDYELPDLPNLLTITEIDNGKILCRLHWDIWYFIKLDKNFFFPDNDMLIKEFYENGWYTFDAAENLITGLSTLKAIDLMRTKI